MRYTRIRVWVIFAVVVIGIIVLLNYSFSGGPFKSSNPITDEQITESYPDLYRAVVQREAGEIEPLLSYEKDEVREQAWRALANTPVDSAAEFIELAREQNIEAAWFALSQHEFSAEQLRELEALWEEDAELRPGIARVLGQQGDEQSLQFLLQQLESGGPADDYPLGLAVGRLVTRYEMGTDEQVQVIRAAFESGDGESRRAYLYGWYREPASELTSTAKDTLLRRWQSSGAGRPDVDQYVNKLLPEETTYTMTIFYNGEQLLNRRTQLAVELAGSMATLELDDRSELAAKILLTNINPHVQKQTLKSLAGRVQPGDDLYTYIAGEMLSNVRLNDEVWLAGVQTVVAAEPGAVEEYSERLKRIAGTNPYLLPEIMAVYEETLSVEEFIDHSEEYISEAEPRRTMFALQGLYTFWESQPGENKERYRDEVRELVFESLEMRDRGVAFSAVSFLEDEQLFDSGDFERINETLQDFSLPGDIEVFQAFGELYKNRFEEEAAPVVESWAESNHLPLNRSLADAGWPVEPSDSDAPGPALRTPDWERLWELGRNPVLRMRTQKGLIDVQLNTLQAPATISAIDSLVRAEAYDSVAFHRVVPNFVVQGGDIERGDGFGGPDYLLPLEGSELEFDRGAAGIASAGPDTEGSQYFFMHQWKPHLNGNYTRFGRVVNGASVVDNITVGDSVLTVRWN